MGIETVVTVFAAQGAAAVVNAYFAQANAADRAAAAYANMQKKQTAAAYEAYRQAAQNAALTSFNSAVSAAQQAIRYTGAIVSEIKQATEEYIKFGRQVMNVKALAGGSTSEAAGFVNLSRAAGINDNQGIREIARLAQDLRNPAGRAALGQLGVSGQGDALKVLGDTVTALRNMQDGTRKTGLEVQAFGIRGAVAIQPLLRMTQQQQDAILSLSRSINGDSLAAIQRLQVDSAILGLTWQQKVIFPLVQQMIPAMITLVNVVTPVVSAFASFNEALHGIPAVAVVVTALGVGFAAVAFNIYKAVQAMVALGVAAKITALWEVAVQVAAGNKVAAAAGIAAIGVAAGAALYYGTQSNKSNGKADAAGEKFSGAVDKFSTAVNKAVSFSGNDLPRNLSATDAGRLAREAARGSIG